MNTRRFTPLVTLLILGASVPSQAGAPKDPFVVFTQKDPVFTETITLYTDGRYKQEETQSQAKSYRLGSLHKVTLPDPDLPHLWDMVGRGGGWLLLDKEGGVPIIYKPGENFPANAVVELKNAMPFGLSWENQQPDRLHGTRYLEASLFQSIKLQTIKPAGMLAHNGAIVPGSPLPNLVRP